MRRCHTASGKASTEQHYRHTQQMWAISSSCWCTMLTTLQHLHGKEPNSASQTEERRNNRHSVSFPWTLLKIITMCCRMKSRNITGPVYHAYCGDIFQEVWCTSSHLTVHHFWWSRARHLFCSWAAENSHALHQGELAPDQICWQF